MGIKIHKDVLKICDVKYVKMFLKYLNMYYNA